jgi:hypothetical protein
MNPRVFFSARGPRRPGGPVDSGAPAGRDTAFSKVTSGLRAVGSSRTG